MSARDDFWSRRKARVQAEEAAEAAGRAATERDAAHRALEAKADDEILADLNLPDPDTLGPGDDFRAFLSQAVPERLRRRALRRLWVSNPTLANVDSLVDYGEDFTDASTVVANMTTAYEVGRGIVRKIDKALAESVPSGQAPEEPPAAATALADPDPESASGDCDNLPGTAPAPDTQDAGSCRGMPARRRMRFAFDTASSGSET